ncbi:MAG: S-methyl-5-thioribose-1-phosphate isomerase [Acidimicrobiia bacterium]
MDLRSVAPFGQIRWADDRTAISVLDQTRLPSEVVELKLTTVDAIEEAIKSLRVRGAPLIGITAAMGIAALANSARREPDQLGDRVEEWSARLEIARPTAVNLTWAVAQMRVALRTATDTGADIPTALTREADRILVEDSEMCRSIGEHGVEVLREDAKILTHCNAGALATGGIGTALAPVYVGHERGMRLRVFADETRPLLQGSRITAWELAAAGIDVTVLTDGMAGALMAVDPPDFVFVGSDRIAANGDAANKIGTYALAVLAHHHGIPVYVLAPTSTVDLDTPTGEAIPIEYRQAEEVGRAFGRQTAPDDVNVWNPAFDVTPAEFITGIITESGIHRPPYGISLQHSGAKS